MSDLRPLLAALWLAGCGVSAPAGPIVTTPDVLTHIHDWNGKEVLVIGWLGQCSAYDCSLSASEADMRILAARQRSDEYFAAIDRSLTIARAAKFDRQSKQLAMRQVIVRATVTDQCHQQTTGKFCLDRAGDLLPIQVYPKD